MSMGNRAVFSILPVLLVTRVITYYLNEVTKFLQKLLVSSSSKSLSEKCYDRMRTGTVGPLEMGGLGKWSWIHFKNFSLYHN